LREVETGQCRKARTQIRQVPPEEAVWQGQAGNARSRTRGARQSATPRACPAVKPVREPDAGDPQVRFDERRWETEPRPRLRHRRSGESRRKQLLPRPTDTAPAADSTLSPGARFAPSSLLAQEPSGRCDTVLSFPFFFMFLSLGFKVGAKRLLPLTLPSICWLENLPQQFRGDSVRWLEYLPLSGEAASMVATAIDPDG
jgi:hypothetical protein